MAAAANAKLEWSLRGATLHEPSLPWGWDMPRLSEIRTLVPTIARETRSRKKRGDALIEAAVARGYIADGWHERVFYGIPKTPAGPGLPLIHQSALVPLICNPAGMQAAESLARSIFGARHLLWSAATIVDVAVFVQPTARRRYQAATPRGARGARIAHTSASGVMRWLRASVLLTGLDTYRTANTASEFWARLRDTHRDWAPLLDMGVVPWMVRCFEHTKVVLMCPETPVGITLRRVERVYTKPVGAGQ